MTAGEMVLIVEDEPMVLDIIERYVERFGYLPLKATNARQGLERLDDHCKSIKCMIVDVNLPGTSGIELYFQALLVKPRICCIMTTGDDIDPLVTRFKEAGNITFLQKPFTLESLNAAFIDVYSKEIACYETKLAASG